MSGATDTDLTEDCWHMEQQLRVMETKLQSWINVLLAKGDRSQAALLETAAHFLSSAREYIK